MKALLIAHPNIIDSASDQEWLKSFCARGSAHAELTLFEPEKHKLADFPMIHAFGFYFVDLLWNLKLLGKKTLLTPSLRPLPPRNGSQKCLELFLRSFRGLSQRTLAPIDQFHYLRNLDQYLLLPEQTSWAASWNLPQDRLLALPQDPLLAAELSLPIYRSLWKRA